MDRLPTLLIVAGKPLWAEVALATRTTTRANDAIHIFDALEATLRMGLSSGLPIVLVAPKTVGTRARLLLSGNSVVDLPEKSEEGADLTDFIAQAIAAGVMSSSNSNGWLLLPVSLPMMQAATLKKIADALTTQSVVFPQYRQIPGYPIGFSAEFFSELIRLRTERDLARLIARYPAQGIDVDDPGVILCEPQMPHAHLPDTRYNMRPPFLI